MNSGTEPKRCPKCGSPIPIEAPQGLCPKCLFQQASFATETGKGGQPKTPPPTREELAVAFPHLEIFEIIGQGGMGFVFKARQPKLDRFVALKILSAALAADPAFAERFTREGRVLARLNHPNIVTIHDFGQANGFFYLLMEFVDGVNLRQAMKVGRFTPAQALAIVPKICEALQFAHNEGILHRDIKPENILLDSKGRVKIADFGIAKLVGANLAALNASLSPPTEPPTQESAAAAPDEGAPPPAALTETGKALGTPQYMAPEQLEHPQDVDQRADIYSLGVVFYEMLTGELPIGRFAPPSEKSAVDPRVDEVVLRTLEKERERRTRSAELVKTQVETITSATGGPTRALSKGPPSRQHVWSPLSVWSAMLYGFSLLLWLGINGFHGLLAPYFPFPQFLSVCGQALQFAAPAIGALALWEFGCGSNRRGLALALFGTFSSMLTTVNLWIVLPCLYLLFPSIWMNDSQTMNGLEPKYWTLLPALLVVELWLLARVWNRFAKANGLSAASLKTSSGEFAREQRFAGWWKASAWVFIIAGGAELATVFCGLGFYFIPLFRLVGLSADRGLANLFAGVAFITLNPRWRTAAIVIMWYAAVGLAFNLAQIASGQGLGAMPLSTIIVRFLGQPIGSVLGEVAELGLIVWPYWMLTSKRGKAGFGFGHGITSDSPPTGPSGKKVAATDNRKAEQPRAKMPKTIIGAVLVVCAVVLSIILSILWKDQQGPTKGRVQFRETLRSQAEFMTASEDVFFAQSRLMWAFQKLTQPEANAVHNREILREEIERYQEEKDDARRRLNSRPDAHRPSGKVSFVKWVALAPTQRVAPGSETNGPLLSLHTFSALFPDEKLKTLLEYPDGRMEEGGSATVTYRRPAPSTYSELNWRFPATFTTENLEQSGSLTKAGTWIFLTNQQPLKLFSIANGSGEVLKCCLAYERSTPPPPNAAIRASVRIGHGSNVPYFSGHEARLHAAMRLKEPANPLVLYSATVPAGYVIQATADWPANSSAACEAITTIRYSPTGAQYSSEWSSPDTFTAPELREAGAQLSRLAGADSIELYPDRPRQVFSITNRLGQVFRGSFELVGLPPQLR